jgi:zinc transport system substrate-binding protein
MRYTISFALASLLAGAAMADVPRVVTDIPPVHSLVAQVMGDLGQPELLLDRGADEHSFQLRPSQAAALYDAGLVFWIGPELTPWLERALETVPAGVGRVALLDAAGTVTRTYAAEKTEDGHGHADEHGHEDEPAEGQADDHADDHGDDHGHDHSGIDPHAWLSPANATVWVGVIAAELSRVDPENAGTYQANAAAAVASISQADTTARVALQPVTGRPVVMFHDAYGYFADHYGLTIAGTIAEGDAADPGAAHLAQLRDMIARGEVICVFPEVQHDPALLEQITEGSTARIGGTLDPVGASSDPGPQMYTDWLTGMAATIAACLAQS